MKKKLLKFVPLLSLLILPVLVFAQVGITPVAAQTCTGGGLGVLICRMQQLLNAILPVLVALGVVYFVWGVVQYVIAGGEEAKKKGRDHIIYGIIGLAIIISLAGLVNLVVKTFELGGQTLTVPSLVPTTTSASSGNACDLPPNPKIQNVFGYVTCLINNSIIPLMFALAIAYFIWGVVQFLILGAGEEAKRTQGKQHMIWGIVALAVMLGVWSLVGILGGSFGIETHVLPQVKP
jgi:hypothetical protein